jgi:hypothetical protein
VYRAQVYRFGDTTLQCLAKSEDMIGHGTNGRMILVSHTSFQRFIAADHPIRILHKKLQGLETSIMTTEEH